MELQEEKQGDISIFTLEGRLDSSTAPTVEENILRSIERGSRDIILNFSHLDFISSAGIRVLVHCHKELEKKKGHICLVSVPKAIENVLYITGFLPYFKVYENSQEAQEAFKKA